MATPRADTYTAASGGAIYAGMAAPAALPAWLQSKPTLQWFAIPGTAIIPTGSGVAAFCGMALAERAGRVWCVVPASGGHGDSADNRVVAMDLMDDAPGWTTKNPASASVQADVAYYSDGKPTSRHTYNGPTYVPTIDRVMLVGVQAAYGNANSFGKVDGVNPGTWLWDGVVSNSPGTAGSGYSDVPYFLDSPALNPATGELWNRGNSGQLIRWSPSVQTYTTTYSGGANDVRGAPAFDTVNSRIFFPGYYSAGNIVGACHFNAAGTTRTALTYNASAAYSAWAAAQVTDVTGYTVFDPVRGRYYWFSAQAGGGTVYVITPGAGNTLDVSTLSLGGGSASLPTAGFTYSRFRYSTLLDGLIYVPANGGTGSTQNTFFLKLA